MTSHAITGLDPCVHCGFCLQGCPTYLATGDEADSPRGRIVLMRGLARGSLAASEPKLIHHLDRCLGCLACEPICPSGVNYGIALESARTQMAGSRPVPLIARATNAVMADKRLGTPLMGMARLVRPVARLFAGGSRLGMAFGMLGATRRLWPEELTGQRTKGPPSTATVPNASSVTLFTGCIMDGLFSHVHRATERTLEANGHRLIVPPQQACCGALHAHTGDHETALGLARRNVAAFAAHPDCLIAVNSGGCGAMLKDYGRLLAGDPLEDDAVALSRRIHDIVELLAVPELRSGGAVRLKVAYDPPCHLLHAQRIAEPPLVLMRSIDGLEIVQHRDAVMCCGSAGSYSLTEVEMSRTVLRQKIDALVAVAPDVVATGNPGCIMQIGAGLAAAGHDIPVVHPIEILDWSYELAGFYDG